MNEKFIKLPEHKTTKIGIVDENGIETGEYLEFDFEDIELPLKYQECLEQHKKNINQLKMQLAVIGKREDKKGKKLLSSNVEEQIKTYKEFYEKEMNAMDLFLGENGCKKLLNGKKPYYSMFEDFDEMLKPILPTLEQSAKSVKDKIMSKYSNTSKEDNILE